MTLRHAIPKTWRAFPLYFLLTLRPLRVTSKSPRLCKSQCFLFQQIRSLYSV